MIARFWSWPKGSDGTVSPPSNYGKIGGYPHDGRWHGPKPSPFLRLLPRTEERDTTRQIPALAIAGARPQCRIHRCPRSRPADVESYVQGISGRHRAESN